MRRGLTVAGLGLALALAALWLAGGFEGLSAWIAAAQKAAQDRLAGAVRALKTGEAGAWAGLLAVCFTYGLLHAAGPGHGKALIGGYGVARRVPMGRLAGLALASALAQAGVAVVLVHGALAVLGLTRDAVTAAGEGWVTTAGNTLIAALGLWLVWRGARGLKRGAGQGGGHGHDHAHGHGHDHGHDHAHDHGHAHDHHHHDHHDHGPDCGCGHAHGPTLDEVAQTATLRDATLLVAGIALRPCSGALFLLVLTWQLGIAGAVSPGPSPWARALASVTVAVALLAVWGREGCWPPFPAPARRGPCRCWNWRPAA